MCVYICGNAFKKIYFAWFKRLHEINQIYTVFWTLNYTARPFRTYLHENVYNIMEHEINSCFGMNALYNMYFILSNVTNLFFFICNNGSYRAHCLSEMVPWNCSK